MVILCGSILILLLVLNVRLTRLQKRLDNVAAAADAVSALGDIDV